MKTLTTYLLLAAAATLASTSSPLQEPRAGTLELRKTYYEEMTDKILFEYPIERFLELKAKGDPMFIWESDGCTGVPDNPSFGLYEFKASCERHDFGYWNYGKQGRCTE